MLFRLFLPSVIAGILGILLAYHPMICVGIVVSCCFAYALVHAITVSKMIQEQLEQARALPRRVVPIAIEEPTTRAVAIRAVENYLIKRS